MKTELLYVTHRYAKSQSQAKDQCNKELGRIEQIQRRKSKIEEGGQRRPVLAAAADCLDHIIALLCRVPSTSIVRDADHPSPCVLGLLAC